MATAKTKPATRPTKAAPKAVPKNDEHVVTVVQFVETTANVPREGRLSHEEFGRQLGYKSR